MAHISSIGAGMFSDLSVCTDATAGGTAIGTPTEANLQLAFAASKYTRIRNVREFPAMGTPPNIVNVPVYGQATSQQVQGQADSPTIELTLNYVASDWAAGTTLGNLVADGVQKVFRFTLLNSEPPVGYDSAAASSIAGDVSDGTQTENSSYFWIGKIESLMVSPQLSDANTATVTISVQSAFFGAFTVAPTA